MMIATGLAMLRGRKDTTGADSDQRLPVVRIALLGMVVGLVSGLVGAGGGFLVVPALALLGGLPMPIAVGTSLVVIAMQSFAGFAGYLASEQIDWRLAAFVTAAAVVGALIGAPPHRVGRPRRAAQGLRLVRPADVLGDPGPGDPPERGYRRGGTDRHCRRRCTSPAADTGTARCAGSSADRVSALRRRERTIYPHG